MIQFRLIIVVNIIIVALLLAAGCMEKPGDGRNVSYTPSPVPIISSLPIPAPIESPHIPVDGYWIKIDPISDKNVGDIFTRTSTTNLTTGEEILVQVYSSTFFPGPKMQTREFSGATGTIKVVQG